MSVGLTVPPGMMFSHQMVIVPQQIEQSSFDKRLESMEYGLVYTAWHQGYSLGMPVWDFWVEREPVFGDVWMAYAHLRAWGTTWR